jgi:hypothetical protein
MTMSEEPCKKGRAEKSLAPVSVAKRMVHFFMYWMEDDIYWSPEYIETPHGLLKFMDTIGGRILELSFFFGIAWTIWQRCANDQIMSRKY